MLEEELFLDLSKNVNPYGPSKKAIECILHKRHLITNYPDNAHLSLKKKLETYTGIPSNQITLGNGSAELLGLITQIFLDSNSSVILSENVYNLYQHLATVNLAHIIKVKENNYHQDLDQMLSAIRPDTKLIIIPNPGNPIGTWIPIKNIINFIERVPSHIMVLIDEAYYEYMSHNDYQSASNLIALYPNLIVTRTFSKIFGLSGLRIGYALASTKTTMQIEQCRIPYNVNVLALNTAEHALSDEEHTQYSLEMNRLEMKNLVNFFKLHEINIISQMANFVTVNFGEYAEIIVESLAKRKILVCHLKNYKLPKYARITVGTHKGNEKLKVALEEIFEQLDL